MSNSAPGMSVHTLGTGGGPIVSSSRAGTSTVVCVDGAAYVIDCGMGSIRNYRSSCAWSDLRGIFLTHHHSDHVYDLGFRKFEFGASSAAALLLLVLTLVVTLVQFAAQRRFVHYES